MSCFVMKDSFVAEIALFCEEALNMGFDFLGIDAPDELRQALTPYLSRDRFFDAEKIFCPLYALNLSAYAERYKNPEMLFDETPCCPAINRKIPSGHRAEYNNHFIVKPWHYRMAKLLDCYLYQCEEGKHPDTDIYKGIKALKDKLYTFIIQNSDDYVSAPWSRE